MQHVKWLKLFVYSVNIPWLTIPQVFVHIGPNCNKNSVCFAKHFTQNNIILHRHHKHASGACEKFHVWYSRVKYSTVTYRTVQFSTVQPLGASEPCKLERERLHYSTVQYSTNPYGTVRLYKECPVICCTVQVMFLKQLLSTLNVPLNKLISNKL